MHARDSQLDVDALRRPSQVELAAVVAGTALGVFATLYGLYHGAAGAAISSAGAALLACALGFAVVRARRSRAQRGALLAVAVAAGSMCALAACNLLHLRPYLLLPVDLLSFSESPFVTDLIKLRIGAPLYTPLADNNSFPYSCGAQMLTYAIAKMLGGATSIPTLRCVQFGYVVAAVLVGTATVRALIRAAGTQPSWLWSALAAPFLLLVATDGRFNMYTHSLHNDGLVLLVSACAFWLLVEHTRAPRTWHVVAMAVLPALGFCVKQSALIWAGLFFLHLLFTRSVGRPALFAYVAATATLVAAVVGASLLAWGEPYLVWIFGALGSKEVAFTRAFEHGFAASGYLLLGLLAGFVFVLRPGRRRWIWPWTACLALFAVESYTSGVAFVANHIGPSALLLSIWFVAALAVGWRADEPDAAPLERWTLQVAQLLTPLVIVGALQLYREPKGVVPGDFGRYVREIEREFAGLPTEKVLLDAGSWIYLRDGVLMQDRAAPVSLHIGLNQAEINHAALSETIERIRARKYVKILAREIDTPRTRYDFGDRGSGVKQALLENYRIVRRIRAVENVTTWWPLHLVAEIAVLEPLDAERR